MTQEMCDKVVNTHCSTIQFVPECWKTQKGVIKLLTNVTCIFWYSWSKRKTQEMCDRIISDDPFSIKYVPDQYKSQKMCDKAVDDGLAKICFWLVCFK